MSSVTATINMGHQMFVEGRDLSVYNINDVIDINMQFIKPCV